MNTVTIAGIPIGDGHPTRICAEIGTNAGGDLDLAMALIRAAKDAGCDFVKGQRRRPELSVPQAEWNELRDTPWGRMPKLVYRHRVEFSDQQWAKLLWFAASIGIPLFASVWDVPSLESMEELGSPCHKIPSARVHDIPLLRAVASLDRPMIISTGMCDIEDVKRAIVGSRSDCLILFQCTSAYPARADESNLRVIQTYKREFGCPVGFSSHKIGIATCLLAVAVGANLIERHITTSRSLPGSDHAISSEPHDLLRLVREIRYAESCLGDGVKRVQDSELPHIKRLVGC